jgi:hypothetical protein
VLSNFISCATGITRLSRPELVAGLLGAKPSEVQDLTPLADLVVPPECRELVRGCRGRKYCAVQRDSACKLGRRERRLASVADGEQQHASRSVHLIVC